MKRQKSRGAWERKLLALAVASCFAAELSHANPVNPTVTHGKATFATHGNTLTVTNTPGAIINWQSFGIASQEITKFLQQSGASAVLNKVTGNTSSSILGQLQSNGRVYLINPNGITIGKGAIIDVAGFVASAHKLSNDDFLAGRHRFKEAAGETASAGKVVVEKDAVIQTAKGGMVYLVGQNIENHGVIRTPQGQIILAAGKSIELVDAGTPEIRVQVTAPDNQALNLGQLFAAGGHIGMYAGLVRHGGTANANTAVVGENGKIVFKAVKDVKLEAGSVTTASGPTAGSIKVEAQTGTAAIAGTVEANATAGRGGNIDISGQQGVTIEPTGRVSADGVHGGTVVLNSSAGEVQVAGQLSANANGGRGGQVAIAAATQATVAAGAKVSASGPQGGGSISVAAGDRIKLESDSKLDASGAVGGTIAMAAEQGSVEVNGTLEATGATSSGGAIKVAALSDITLGDTSVLNVSGKRGGETWIEAREGTTLASGLINAYGHDGPGGKVLLLGPRVGLVRNATVNASGYTGGGVVLVGGDFQGKNPDIQNSERTYVGPEALITADAISRGDGGKVIIWADDWAVYAGSITARGGARDGDGGFVEVSGKRSLEFYGKVDVSAPRGKQGTLLLDPLNITITGNGNGNLADNSEISGDGEILSTERAGDSLIIDEATIENASLTNAIKLQATNNITINDLALTGSADGEINVAGNISLEAGNSITFNNTADKIVSGGNISLTATTGGMTLGGLTASGNVTLNSGGTVTQGTTKIDATGLELIGGGIFVLNTANNVISKLAANVASLKFRADGGFEVGTVNTAGLTATGDVTLDSAGTVTQTQAIQADGLLLLGTGTYTLNHSSNDVVTIAADGPTGASYTDSNNLTVGTVDGTNGMNVAGDIQLTTLSGGVLVIDQSITTTANGNITLDNDDKLHVNATINADGNVIQNGNGIIVLNSDIFTSNDLVEFAQDVLLSGPREINTAANPGTGAGGTIRFLKDLDGGGNSLTLATPGTSGDVEIDGAASNLSSLTITNARDVRLQDVDVSGAVDITAQRTARLEGALTTANSPVILKANDLALTGSIGAGSGAVQIRSATPSRAIELGATGADPSVLRISDVELNKITTSGMLTIGGANQTGTITVTNAISPADATGGFTLLNRTGGIVIAGNVTYNGAGAAGNLFITANAGNSASGSIIDADPGNPFAIQAGNLALRAATGIGTSASPMDIVAGTVSGTNTQSGGIFLRTTNGDLTVGGAGLTSSGAVELTANATGATPSGIDVNGQIQAGGRVLLRAADDIVIDAPVSSGLGANDHVYIVAGKASGMNISGVAPASETLADSDGSVRIRAGVQAGAGDIVINATESVIQAPQPPANSGGGAAGLQNTGNLIVRTYNNTAGAGIIDLRHDDFGLGNSNGPITLETRKATGSGFASSNINYRSYIGMVISGIGTGADFVAIAATQDINLDALNIQARNLTLIADDGNVNVNNQITNSQINNGNDGGSLNLLAGSKFDPLDPLKGNVNINSVAGKRGITIGRFKSTGDSTKDFDPNTGQPTPEAIEKFDHNLRLVAQNDINIKGSIYINGDLSLRADASVAEATKVGGTRGYGDGQGSVRISVPGRTPVVVSAENIVVGTLDSQGRPLPVQNLILTAGSVTPGPGQRKSASASLEAARELEIFLTGNLELTGGTVSASNLPDASSRVENAAAATIGGNVVTILGVSSKDSGAANYHPDAPATNTSSIILKGGTSEASRTGSNDGLARADASALILSGTTGRIDIGGDVRIEGGTANATGARATAVAIAGSEIGSTVTTSELLNIVARDMYITGGTGSASDGGVAEGFASLATAGAVTIVLEGSNGLTFKGGAGSGFFDYLGSTQVRVTGTGFPVTLVGPIQPLDHVVNGQDGRIVAGAPLVDESLLAAFLRATEAARHDSIPQDPNLQDRGKGPAGVCR